MAKKEFKPHLFLKNNLFQVKKFNISRGMDLENNSDSETPPPEAYTNQKENFRIYKGKLIQDRKERKLKRSLKTPTHIEYLKLYFFTDFDNDLRTDFETDFGLAPVFYQDLNQTVTLSIVDEYKFNYFLTQLDLFINSKETVAPQGKSYSKLININYFEFLTSDRISKFSKKGNIVIQLVDSLRIIGKFKLIKESLESFLALKGYEVNFLYNDLIEVKNISEEDYNLITDNFDIIEAITSFKLFNRRPGLYGEASFSQYEITIDKNAPLVGVIDTGVSRINFLKDIILDFGLDLTSMSDPKAYIDDNGHGTSTAGLVAYGKQMYQGKEKLKNDALIVPIKAMSEGEDNFSIHQLIKAIKIANSKGVRIFNLSINETVIKKYNENISNYAFLLDKLSYELDILIFISSGNLDTDFVDYYHNKTGFKYPEHFFNPNFSPHNNEGYDCSETNICPPADSMNNITVGAIAENFEDGICDASYDKSLPAYYSKKWHISSNFPLNGAKKIKKSLINNHIFKPDVLNAGGDLLTFESGMKVMSNDITKPFFSCAGSSLSAPLTANLAARILKLYPSIKMQSVKALIINSSKKVNISNISIFSDLILNIKKRHSTSLIGKNFSSINDLSPDEKRKLSSTFSAKKLENTITGNGIPKDEVALESNKDRITLIYEHSVKTSSYHGFKVNLPEYIRSKASNSSSSIFNLSITLTYSFDPILGNSSTYNPVHISFNALRNFTGSVEETISFVSDRSKGHENAYYKKGLSWSDDFYPLNSKPFSNCQKITRKLSAKDLKTLIDNFIIVVRCNSKTTSIDPLEYEKIKNKEHEFSLVLTLEEIEKKGQTSGKLYDEIVLRNKVEAIAELDSDIELSLE